MELSPAEEAKWQERKQTICASDKPRSAIRQQMVEMIATRQEAIRRKVNALEAAACGGQETPAQVAVDIDNRRPEGKFGCAMVIQDGRVFEKGGFSMTILEKGLTVGMAQRMSSNHHKLRDVLEAGGDAPLSMWVCGLSLILHPHHPLGSTVHLNYRYFEVLQGDDVVAWWFGGGNDLTPIYLNVPDAIHFHQTLKDVCDRHDTTFYPKFKEWADRYFYHTARKEARGVGGIFFDDLTKEGGREALLGFITDCLDAFMPAYFPSLESKLQEPVTDAMKTWQALRHGRYVEFNLVYDRGTKFGFQVPGVNIENVLVSLPLTNRFEYKHQPAPGSPEEALLVVLTGPAKNWVSEVSEVVEVVE